jgi:hypothetical protein
VLRAPQALFFPVPEREQDRTPRRLAQRQEPFDHFQDPGDATGIVVRPVMDDPQRSEARLSRSVTHMIVVSPDDHEFVPSISVASFEYR